jgi:acylglycerol lipase
LSDVPAPVGDRYLQAGARKIFWRSWGPAGGPAQAIVVIAHGFGEHSGRYAHVAERLTGESFAVYALDLQGHGRSDGPRARISFAEAVADLDQLVVIATDATPEVPVFLLGHSMGGAVALRYAMAHSDRLAGLILSGPLAEVEGRQAARVIGRALGALAPGLPVARLDPGLVSRDPAVVKAYVEDPLVHHKPIPAGTVAEFLRHADSLPSDVSGVRLPTLLMYGTADGLCAPSGSVMISERIGSTDLTVIPYDGLYHEIFNEPERDRVLGELCAWIAARSKRAPL